MVHRVAGIRGRQSLARHVAGVGAAQREHLAEPAGRLGVVTANGPVPAERGGQPDRGLGVRDAGRVAQRRAEVVVLAAQPGQVGRLAAGAQQRLRHLGPGQEVAGVSPPEPVGFTRLGQRGLRVRPDGVQHPVLRRRTRRLPELREGLVGQRAEQHDDVPGGQHLIRADRLGRLRGGAAGEDREPPGQRSLRLGEQVPAPPDDREQRLVAGERGAAASGQQPEPVVKPAGDLRRGQRAEPCAGQLDGQRKAVQAPADLGHRRQVLWSQPESEPRGGGPVGEQPQRGHLQRVTHVDRRRWHRERRHRIDLLARGGQRLTGRGQDPHPRAAAQDLLGQPGAGVDEMLAVVQHDEQPPVA